MNPCWALPHPEAQLIALDACVEAMESTVDAAYGRGDPLAVELDVALAQMRERYAEIESELADWERPAEFEVPDYHQGISVEEQLIVAYTHWLKNDARGPFGGRECVIAHMRAVLEDGAQHSITASDDEVLAAARDVFEAQLARQARRARAAPVAA